MQGLSHLLLLQVLYIYMSTHILWSSLCYVTLKKTCIYGYVNLYKYYLLCSVERVAKGEWGVL
jgi:hypothetical protein